VGTFSAVAPGTDLTAYARELRRLHEAVISGSTSPKGPRPLVARSWSRVLDVGLQADGSNPRHLLPVGEIERRRAQSALSAIIGELQQVIAAVAEASHMLMVVTDADGVILWRSGAAKVRHYADSLGFSEGAEWTERMVGTNAIGTALAEAAPVQLFSAEHFEQRQHPWYCTASPIHDPRTGDLLGIVDISGPAMTLHPTVSALLATAVRLAESQLWRHHEVQLERLRASAAPVLASVSGPVLLVDDHGWVAHTSGVSAMDRVAAPRGELPIEVPGLGLCLPEQLAHGWLIRPTGAGTKHRMVLDLTGKPTLEVVSAESSWRSALSGRHSEILQLLHRSGRVGLTAAQLSQALYGDLDHIVTVRAEISRLRRAFGAIVESTPYRLAESVELTVRRG
jgi:hypothetical protein